MSNEPALLAAVAANPDDDLPRLVYADWLEENGNPDRAEFIRVQCALSKTGRLDLFSIEDCEAEAARRAGIEPDQEELRIRGLLERNRQLLNSHPEWMRDFNAQIREIIGTQTNRSRRDYIVGVWDRGFPGLVITSEEYIQNAEKLHAALPLTKLIINEGGAAFEEGYPAALFRVPEMRNIRSLTLACGLCTRENARALANSPLFSQLQKLYITSLSDNAAYELARANKLDQLKTLEVEGASDGTSEAGARYFVRYKGMPKLEQLEIKRFMDIPPDEAIGGESVQHSIERHNAIAGKALELRKRRRDMLEQQQEKYSATGRAETTQADQILSAGADEIPRRSWRNRVEQSLRTRIRRQWRY